jgi:serine/threonine protein kinase
MIPSSIREKLDQRLDKVSRFYRGLGYEKTLITERLTRWEINELAFADSAIRPSYLEGDRPRIYLLGRGTTASVYLVPYQFLLERYQEPEMMLEQLSESQQEEDEQCRDERQIYSKSLIQVNPSMGRAFIDESPATPRAEETPFTSSPYAVSYDPTRQEQVDKLVVVKIFHGKHRRFANNEYANLRKLARDRDLERFFPFPYQLMDDGQSSKIFLSEYVHGISVTDLLPLCSRQRDYEKHREEFVYDLAHKVFRNIYELCRCGLIHKDLNLDNILVDEGLRVRFIDFASSCDTKRSKDCYSTVGVTPVVYSKPLCTNTGIAFHDMWSMLIVISALYNSRTPAFDGLNVYTYYRKFCRDPKMFVLEYFEIPNGIFRMIKEAVLNEDYASLLELFPDTIPKD